MVKIFLCKRTCKWVTSMLHKSPTWTPGWNATIHMAPLIGVVEGHSNWKYICMTLLWHLALELVGMRRWFPKNGDSPESQDEINLWVKSAADLWCCSNISKYEQISWKCSSLEEKNIVNILAWHNLLGQETPRNQFPDNSKRYHIWKLLLKKNTSSW